MPAPEPSTLSATSILIHLRGSLDPGPYTFRIELDDRVWTVSSRDTETVVTQGEPEHADGSIRTDPRTLNLLIDNPKHLSATISEGLADADGDIAALFRQRRVG